MHWKIKAVVQSAIAALPPKIGNPLYFQVQSRFGAYRNWEGLARDRVVGAAKTWEIIEDKNKSGKDKTFFEIGTGRAPVVPLVFWLMGAKSTVTVDLNVLLSDQLVARTVEYLVKNESEINEICDSRCLPERFEQLRALSNDHQLTPEALTEAVLKLCGIEYRAPADASDTGLANGSIDFFTSFTVLEHIPRPVLSAIAKEGYRLLDSDGASVHMVGFYDHFYPDDPNITSMNYLQFGDTEWDRWAGNRFMYMNRLNHDETVAALSVGDHDVETIDTTVDSEVLERIASGDLVVHPRFSSWSETMLATTISWLYSAP